VTYATNHIFVAEPVVCGVTAGGGTTNSPGLYQGIGKIRFVKTSYDSLLGQFYQPITNTYTMVLQVNHQSLKQTFQRVVTAPDFLISAGDLANGPADYPPGVSIYSRNINFNQANALPGLAGPGTIDTATTITFDKSGRVYFNGFGGNELNAITSFIWGSFDGTTNAPVAYPNGTSLANLAKQVLVQISPANNLPDGTNGVIYPATTFVATGGPLTPPFTWSLPSGGLPPGLTLSTGGTISGTPTQTGAFDTIIQLTDSLTNFVNWSYPITIH